MNDIVGGVQQYHSSLVSNLRRQVDQVLKKHLECASGHLQKEVMDVFDRFADPFMKGKYFLRLGKRPHTLSWPGTHRKTKNTDHHHKITRKVIRMI